MLVTWEITDRLKRYLINNDEPETCYVKTPTFKKFQLDQDFGKENCLENYKKYIPVDELFFFTECNLLPSKRTQESKVLENKFLSYILDEFKAPRIILYNPAKQKEIKRFEELNFHYNIHIKIKTEKRKKTKNEPIKTALFKNKRCNHLILKTLNLTSAIPYQFLFELKTLIKETGEIWYG